VVSWAVASVQWPSGYYKNALFMPGKELMGDRRFNSDDYLRNPIVYDGVTKKTSRSGKKAKPFVHYFNTTGIMQHNDIAPQWHPTDVGAIKVASHLQQFIRIKFDWDLYATGPE
jgi:hypothetical protein